MVVDIEQMIVVLVAGFTFKEEGEDGYEGGEMGARC